MLPEVILLAEPDHVVGRDADILCPDIISLVVVKINADKELVLGHFHYFRAEFPCPMGSLLLEVIAEREVAEHLKEGAVARGDTDPLDIGGTDALLAGSHPLAGRGKLACEVLLERRHARIDEQEALIPLRHEREARKPQMTL